MCFVQVYVKKNQKQPIIRILCINNKFRLYVGKSVKLIINIVMLKLTIFFFYDSVWHEKNVSEIVQILIHQNEK